MKRRWVENGAGAIFADCRSFRTPYQEFPMLNHRHCTATKKVNLLKGLAVGLVGGLAASWAMNQFQSLWSRLSSGGEGQADGSEAQEQKPQDRQERDGQEQDQKEQSQPATANAATAIPHPVF